MCTAEAAHNPEVAGSNPAPGTENWPWKQGPSSAAQSAIATSASVFAAPPPKLAARSAFDALRNDIALGLSNSRVDLQLHQVSVAWRALEKLQPRRLRRVSPRVLRLIDDDEIPRRCGFLVHQGQRSTGVLSDSRRRLGGYKS